MSTVDIEPMNDLAAHSLDLVNRELTSTLDAARRELEDFVDGNAGRDALNRAADLLHLAHGALKIIEMDGAALLADEMEQLCRHVIATRDQAVVDGGLEALTRGMVQLPAYLERVMSGGRDVALVLLPLLNDLRQARGTPILSEGSLLLLNAGPFERHLAARPQAAVSPEASRRFQLGARRLRPAFQAALLRWIRGESPTQHLDKLIQISSTLEKTASSDPVQQLWFVLTGVLIGLRAGRLEPTVNLKRLVGQADRQLKRLIDDGEAAWASAAPVDLLNRLLYYIARAGGDHERLVAIRKRYRLDEALPDEQQLAELREGLAGPSVKLMRTVAQAIKEDLSSVKDALDIFVRTGMDELEPLNPQLDMLKKIGDTLGVLGLEKARTAIQHEAKELRAIVESGRIDGPAVLERIAATLLDVEDQLDRELVRAVVPGAATAEAGDTESDTESQYRHVTQAVIGECIVNLAKVKDAVAELIDNPTDGRAIEQVRPLLRGITAGFLMLNKTKAVKVVERIGQVIATRLGPGAKALKPEYLERLADAVVSIEYYMETISRGRADPGYMLDNANRCLDLLEALPQARRPAAPAPQSAPAPPVPKAPKRPPSVMEVHEERSDPELLELFIEEAKEEFASIERYLPMWAERPEDSDALISVRRSFHTLKGSGRMVGAQMIGEFAWSIENLLNRLINQTLEATPAMIEFIREAAGVLPQLVEQLEIGIAPRADVTQLMKRAAAFADGDPEVAAGAADESAAHELPSADAAGHSGPHDAGGRGADDRSTATDQATDHTAAEDRATAADDADAASSEMDPVLSEIFVKETLGHLETIRAYLDSARRGVAPFAVDEPLYRACHTLLGSAKMAAYAPAVALARPLSEHLGRLYQAGRSFDAQGLATLVAATEEIERMGRALADGAAFAPDGRVVDALERWADAEHDAAAPTDDEADGASDPGEFAASFDPEIAAIFTEEAAEILDNAELALEALRSDAAQRSAVVELQRLLHTLKGGARMAGITPMGDLSHALETLLAAMAEQRVEATPDSLELLQTCLDALHAMRDRIDSGKPITAEAELIRRVEGYSGARPAEAPTDSADVTDEDRNEPLGDESAVLESGDEPTARQPQLRAVDLDVADTVPEAGEVDSAGDAESPRPESEADGEVFADAETSPDVSVEVSEIDWTLEARGLGGDLESAGTQEAGDSEVSGARDADPGDALAGPVADATAERGADTTGEPVADATAERGADATAEPVTDATADPVTDATAEPVGDAAAELAADALDGTTPESTQADRPAAPAARLAERRSAERADTARVDAGVLDALLNGAGEISIFQSRLNQQLHSIEFNLGELGQTVTRLREQLRKLEAETEAQILYRHQEEAEAGEDFDPLELDRYSTIQQLSRALAETANDVASINELLQELTNEADTLLTQQARVTGDLQEGLMRTRMVPFQRHASRLSRIVRQAAADTRKSAELVLHGGGSELDRQVLDNMLAPFEHLLRNAVVHGLESGAERTRVGKPETGRVELKLRREGSEVLIEVADDGRGLDLDAIRRKALEQRLIDDPQKISDEEAVELILRPGFSTASELTQAAGRGVGMDVVDNEVKKLGGSMRIESQAGRGTRFFIRLPYTLAVTHALIVNVADETFALPLPTIEGVTRVPRESLLDLLTQDDPKLEYGGVTYRVQHLGTLVGGTPSALPDEEGAVSLVLVRAGDSSSALLTDSLEGSREIVVKTLGPHLGSIPGVSGATILGDGRVIVILDAGTLVRDQRRAAQAPVPPPVQPRQLTALVVDDSITMRRVTQRLLERRGVRVLTARDGLDAITVLQENEPDIILLDIEMPRMDGYQFASHVRNDQRLADVPIVMITSRSGEKHRAKAIELGVNDYLGKPYQEGQLIASVEALLGRKL